MEKEVTSLLEAQTTLAATSITQLTLITVTFTEIMDVFKNVLLLSSILYTIKNQTGQVCVFSATQEQ